MNVVNHDTNAVLDIVDRAKNFNNETCWQYDIRIKNRDSDLLEYNLTIEDVADLKISDFTFHFIPKTDKETAVEIKKFIEKHEWLGKVSLYPTHYFIAKYNNIMAGVVIMDMPNAFSKLLGDKTRKIERLISRGACISWSPKNLASALISFSMKWMVKNTNYRVFTAYSDPEAKELGTIYQACNFSYLGQNSGTNKQYKIESGKWVSDRYFRSRSVYKKIAVSNGVNWNDEWVKGDSILWGRIDPEIAKLIKQSSKNYQNSCEVRTVPKKHKYVYILGINKKETKELRKEFETLNPKLKKLKYPKERGAK
jgi:hypothetical protein